MPSVNKCRCKRYVFGAFIGTFSRTDCLFSEQPRLSEEFIETTAHLFDNAVHLHVKQCGRDRLNGNL